MFWKIVLALADLADGIIDVFFRSGRERALSDYLESSRQADTRQKERTKKRADIEHETPPPASSPPTAS